jgi:transcriptional regulator with GAF, ATPase, and Fis domain
MDSADLVASISNSLTQLDTILSSGDPPFTSPQWQHLFELRKHLDDQQRSLLQQVIQTNDAAFIQAAGNLKMATETLTEAIAAQKTIDTVINIVAQVSAAADAVLSII